MELFSQKYLNDLRIVLERFPHACFMKMIDVFMSVYKEERNIFVMGNGGSGSIASHWAGDINKGCCLRLDKKFKMICLHDNISTMMAYANDLSYDQVFVEPLKNFFHPKDMVIGISGSGNSKNILNAIEYANNHEGITVGLCGYGGGKLRDMVTIPLWIEVDDMQKVEDVAMIIVHMAMQAICKQISIEKTC